MHVDIDIESASTSVNIPADDQFANWVSAALHGREGAYRLAIRIVDEAEMRRFNFQYRHKDHATNVLSFPADLPANLPAELRDSVLGDLLICAPLVEREAHEQKRPATDHWAHLTVHGVLHLLGHDHQHEDEARVMESLETEILAKLGIPDPYGDMV
jgi:probable rRNA maturation factor